MNNLGFYNKDIKEEYIAIKEKETLMPKNFLKILFNQSAEFEYKLDKDISNFTVEEIMEFYKACNRKSVESISVIHSSLNMYTIWCLTKNLVIDFQNHYSEISKDKYSTCVNTMYKKLSYITYDTIKEWLKEIVNVADQFLILALFEGLSGDNYKEINELYYSDFNDLNVHLCTGRTIKVSKELKELARQAAEEIHYYTIGENQKEYTFIEDDDKIIKSYHNTKLNVSEFQKGRRLYNKIKRNMTYLGYPYLKGKDIIESGKVNYIIKRCKELNISGHDFLYSDHIKELDKQFGSKCVRSIFERTYKDYLPK